MSFYAISALINALTSLILGSFVFLKKRKSSTDGIFIFLSLSVFVWSFFYFLWQISDDHDSALFYTRLLSVGSILVPIFYLHWVISFLEIKSKRKTVILFLGYIATCVFLFFSFSPFFIIDVGKNMGFNYWPKAGYLYGIYLFVSYFGFVGYGFIELIRNYLHSVGGKRHQIRYIILGSLAGFLGGATNFFLWYDIQIPPFANIAVSLYVFLLFYAMARYRLMDMRVIARKIFIYLGVATFAYGAFCLIAWFYGVFFGGVFTSGALTVGLLIAPLFVLGFYLVDSGMKIFANKYLFVSLYSFQKTINRLTDELANYIDLNTVIDLIVDTIKKTIQLDKAGVFLIDTDSIDGVPCRYKIAKNIGFKDGDVVLLVEDIFLNDFLIKTQKPLVCDELAMLSLYAKNSEEKNNFMRLYDYMNGIEATICLPLMSNKKLSGVIVLGSKISGDAYTKEDLELLNTLSKQAGITIDNARLYKEVRDFNSTLKQKVDEQTKDIKEKADRLEKTLKIKSEFIYLMSHQLRTPISVIVGMASMLKDGDLENAPIEKKKEFVDGIYMKSKKLADILNDFIKAESMDGESFDFDSKKIEKVNMGDIVKSVCDEFTVEIKEKNINLEFEAVNEPLQITTDPHYLKQAIANIVNNAIKYTQKGFIKVKVYSENNRAICEISDSGIGIPKDDQVKLFHKFVRAKNAVDAYAYGTGLGLFMVKKIVEAHNGGKIDFISEEDKGTTFKISIPIAL